jgi:hypothetical protein
MLLGKDNSGYVAESHAIAAAWAGFKGSVQQVAGGMYLYSRQLQQLLHSAARRACAALQSSGKVRRNRWWLVHRPFSS